MSTYTEAGDIAHRIGETDRYILTKPLQWDLGFEGSAFPYRVEAGFTFDVSIPAILTFAFSRHDRRFLKAAAVHGHMLKAGWSRPEAAGPFHQMLKADGVSSFKRLVMFVAVALWKWR